MKPDYTLFQQYRNMWSRNFVFVFCLFCLAVVSSVPVNPYEGADFYQLLNDPDPHLSLTPRRNTAYRITEHGYPVEHHHVVTEDNYIIGMFRIPYSHKLQNQNEHRPIVLLLHGLWGSSDNWIHMGPDNALSFLLADSGYDVWIGNGRGNTYSRNHTSRSTENPKFWRFSWHEIGYFDIAAMIDYALTTNGQNQQAIHYVGHSQGTTVFFVLMSLRPEYNVKIKTAHMLAPVAYMDNMEDFAVRLLAPYLGHYNTYSRLFASQEFIPYNDFLLALLYNTCRPESRFANYCDGLLYDSNLDGRANSTAVAMITSLSPAGTSTDQILHYMQEQQSGHFREFDFGPKKNIQVYGTELPPDYPTQLITCKMHMWYSDNDAMAAVVDVLRVAETLPNKEMHHMDDPLWDHGDFATNWEVRKYINDPVMKIIDDYEAQIQ